MELDAKDLLSYATECWEKKVADKELNCWGTGTIINEGDTYYEYIMELTLYGQGIDISNPTVTENEYFKHVLQGKPGYKYYDKT